MIKESAKITKKRPESQKNRQNHQSIDRAVHKIGQNDQRIGQIDQRIDLNDQRIGKIEPKNRKKDRPK